MTREIQPTAPSRIPWPPLLLVAAIAGAWLAGRIWPVAWPGIDDLPARLIGFGIGAAGLALAAWAIATMASARVNIRPDRPATGLVTTGPFRIWRHPIYMADSMILLGLAQATFNIWFVVAALLFGLAVRLLAIAPEERHLEERFGATYLAWKAHTRLWF